MGEGLKKHIGVGANDTGNTQGGEAVDNNT